MVATSRVGLRRRAESSPYATQLNDKTQGTCSFYPPDVGGCRAPRSCYDCLNAQLDQEPDGCMINEVGRCVSVPDNYDPWLDFRVASAAPLGGQGTKRSSIKVNSGEATKPPSRRLTDQSAVELQFPADNTTYCDDSDVLFDENQLADRGFMVGTDGCVFVAVCEAPSWVYAVGGSDCTGLTATDWDGPDDIDPREDDKGASTQGYLVFWCVAIAIILTLVATLAMVVTMHHHRSKRRFEEMQRRRTIVVGAPLASVEHTMTPKSGKPGVRLLDLFGWEAMRANLIEKERQERLCVSACQTGVNSINIPGVSPSTNYLQLVGAAPSAPAMSPVDSSAPRLTDC